MSASRMYIKALKGLCNMQSYLKPHSYLNMSSIIEQLMQDNMYMIVLYGIWWISLYELTSIILSFCVN